MKVEVILFLILGAAVVLVTIVQILYHWRIQCRLQDIEKENRETQHLIQRESLKQYSNYRQIEALFSMFSVLKIKSPLPPMGDWTILPDFANIIISLIHDQKPGLVIEAGSGISTLIAAYCLKDIGEGVIISLEHEKNFADINSNYLIKHDLQDFGQVIHAPLKEVIIQNKKWLWYDTAQIEQIKHIDMLIIDGPPYYIQKLSRYPALPILSGFLNHKAVILLDDGYREDEKEIVDLWLNEFNCFKYESIDTEKGVVVLTKIN